MRCFDCGGLMYCHRTSNGKRVANFVCANYGKVPVGSKCSSGHRINADAVIDILRDTLRYLKSMIEDDPELFVEQITQVEFDNRDAESKKKQDRLKVCKKRIADLEKLICKIYEDNALGKMPESRYETLISQYSKEQSNLRAESEANRHNGKNFINLMARYNNFDEITPFMDSEFVDKIVVHERDRKGSQQTTQKIDIYFNFIGNYCMTTPELTPEEKEERNRIEAIKDKRHKQYLERKEKQRAYEKAYEPKRKARKKVLKKQNPNTFGIPAEQYDKEHYLRESVILANSVEADF